MFIGDDGTFTRRHYRNVWDDIHASVDTQVEKMAGNFNKLMNFKRAAEQRIVDPRAVASMAGRMYFNDIITSRMLGDIKKEIRTSDLWAFDQNESGELEPDTLWKFYNNCTEAIKRAPATDYVNTHRNVTQFLVDHNQFFLN